MKRRKAKGAKVKKRKLIYRSPAAAQLKFSSEPPDLIIRRAARVEAVLARLPPGALSEGKKEDIRRDLSVLTDGEVGGYKFRVKNRKAAKQSALKSLKRTAGELTKKAAGKMAEQAGFAAWLALAEALRRLVDIFERATGG